MTTAMNHTMNPLQEGMDKHRAGDLAGAELIYKSILAMTPKNSDAISLLGMVYQSMGRQKEALMLMNESIALSRHFLYLNRRASLLHGMGENKQAIEDAKASIKIESHHPEAYVILLAALRANGDTKKAIELGRDATQKFPSNPDVWNNYGGALQDKGDLQGALAAFEQTLRLVPGYLKGHENAARLAWQMGDVQIACQHSEEAFRASTSDVQVLLHWVKRLEETGQVVSGVDPFNVWTHLFVNGDIAQLKSEVEKPEFLNKAFQFADLHQKRRNFEQSNAILINLLKACPESADIMNNLGVSYFAQSDPSKALQYFSQAVKFKPENSMFHRNTGVSHFLLVQPEEARVEFEKAYLLDDGSVATLLYYFGQCLQCADWSRYNLLKEQLVERTRNNTPDDLTASLAYLAAVEKASDMRMIAEKVGASLFRGADTSVMTDEMKQRSADKRIRVGYYSYDFRTHPVTYLTEEMYGLHDRSKFEIYALSYGPDDGSVFRKTVEKEVDHFIDLQNMTPEQMAGRIRDLQIDIVVDLTGNTQGGKSQVMGYRVAPVQCHWLGYVWSMGHRAYDYIIADPFSIPEKLEHGYVEKAARLPHTLQIVSRKLQPSERVFKRSEFGLPEEALVLCNFGSFGKLQPDLFGAWMRMLNAMPHAVLWLARTHRTPPEAFARLREQVLSHGVNPDRVIFSEPLSREEHLRRYELADIALDTYPQGSGTTAIEALYMGCPMLSMADAGETLAIRMAGGILHAVELDELVVSSLQAYEDLGIELGKNPQRLQKMREHLLTRRNELPLFDTPKTVKYLERAYQQMWQTHCAGQEPQSFTVAP